MDQSQKAIIWIFIISIGSAQKEVSGRYYIKLHLKHMQIAHKDLSTL